MASEKELSQDELRSLRAKYEKLLSENPSSAVFVFLGEILIKLGEINKATDVLINGLKHNPQNITGKFILGKIFYEKGMTHAAKKEMEEIVQRAPDNAAAGKILVQIYRGERKLDSALDIAETVASFFPGDNEINEIILELKREVALAEESEKVLPSFEENIDESAEYPSDEELNSVSSSFKSKIYTETMADLFMNQGLYEDAFEILAKLYEQNPENTTIRMKLEEARAYFVNEKLGYTTKR